MIDIIKACKLALEYYKENTDKTALSKVYDHKDMWIIYARSDKIEYGGYGISINKNTGEIRMFTLPSQENFAILKDSVLVDIPNI